MFVSKKKYQKLEQENKRLKIIADSQQETQRQNQELARKLQKEINKK